MPRRHARILIAPGIYRDGAKLIAQVQIGSRESARVERKPYPLGTQIHVMQAWQHATKSRLLLETPRGPIAGTLAADVQTFLQTLPAGPYVADSALVLKHWARSPHGAQPRRALTRLDVIAQISAWTDAGAAANTCTRRVSRLRKLFHTLDGPFTPNPTDGIKKLREPEPENREIPTRIVKLILACVTDQGRAGRGEKRSAVSLTKIRLAVQAWTGALQATIRRIKPRDLDLAHGRIFLRRREKGKGVTGAWIALLPEAVTALRAFADAGLFGIGWSNGSAGVTWRVGIKRATAIAVQHFETTGDRTWLDEIENLPPRCRPYDLRHSLASAVYAITGDIRAVAEMLQHADLETTKRYTKGAVSARVSAAIAQAAPHYAAAATIPTPGAPARLRLVKTR